MISIIIPLYNKEKCIRKTIDSILNQKNFSDFEVVVVDDGSTDKSCEIVASYQDPRIKLYKKKNGGPSSARNYGVQKAEGQWIIYLDADDTFFDYTLSLFHKTSLKHPQYNCFSGNIARVDDKGLRVVNPMAEGEITNPYRAWLTKRFCSRTGAAMYRKYILTKYPFDERYRRFEDLEQSLRIMKNEKFYNLST